MIYAEISDMGGRWTPVTYAELPRIERGRVKRTSGVGPKIRTLGTDDKGQPIYGRKVSASYKHLNLDQLRNLYSPDGAFVAEGGRT